MPNSDTPISVFMLYSSLDRATVEPFYSNLEEIGVKPWMDIKNLMPGLDWYKEIMLALSDSKLVLLFFSSASINRNSFFQKEIKYALNLADEKPEGEIYIIPIRLDDCYTLDRLAKYQYIDFSKSKRQGWKSLIRVINEKQRKLGIPLSPYKKLQIEGENVEAEEDSTESLDFEKKSERKLNNMSLNFLSQAKTTTDIFSSIFQVLDNFLLTQSGDIEKIAAAQIKLLTNYYSLVLNQAQRSFTWALIWAFVGILSFISAGVFLLTNHLDNIAYLGAIGGALIEIISGINFYLYNKSSSQLAEFHARLDSTQRILLANSICEKIEGDLKQETRSQLALAFAGVVTPQSLINEKEHSVPLVRISKINSNPEGKDIENESIEITNFSDGVVNMTEWKLLDKANHEFIFPNYSLNPRQSVSIWTKAGKDTEAELFWNKSAPIWNNTQDCAYLKTNNGVLIDFYCYTSKQKAG